MNTRFRNCLWFVSLLQCSCTTGTENPSFPLSINQAEIAWSAMQDNPKPLFRPVVVLGSIYDPGLAAKSVADSLREIAGDDAPIVHIGFIEAGSFDRAASKVIEAVNREFRSDDPSATVEVDVIGFSMGGLVARYAASSAFVENGSPKLRIARLFTVSSPHSGAKLSWVPTVDRRVIDMRPDSEFLAALNCEERNYELVAYARLGDEVVGEHNAATPGETPWWISKRHGFSHAGAYGDTRILVDIARRLRDEQPFTTNPPAAIPARRSIS